MAIQQSEEVIAGGDHDDYLERRHVVFRGKTSVPITHHATFNTVAMQWA